MYVHAESTAILSTWPTLIGNGSNSAMWRHHANVMSISIASKHSSLLYAMPCDRSQLEKTLVCLTPVKMERV